MLGAREGTAAALSARAFASWRAERSPGRFPFVAVPEDTDGSPRTDEATPPRADTATRSRPGASPRVVEPVAARNAGPPDAEAYLPAGPVAERITARRGPCAHLAEALQGRFRATPQGVCHVVEGRISLDATLGDAPLRAGLDHADAVPRLGQDIELAPWDSRDALFVDLETTGLRADAGAICFLVGLGQVRGGAFRVRQIVAHAPEEEAAMLAEAAREIARARALVTFNGARFDLPFLKARMEAHGIDAGVLRRPHLDLYRASRAWIVGLSNRRQVTHEAELLGFCRDGDLPGQEAPARFRRAQSTGDVSGLIEVLEHNRLDVAAMLPLVGRMAARLATEPMRTEGGSATRGPRNDGGGGASARASTPTTSPSAAREPREVGATLGTGPDPAHGLRLGRQAALAAAEGRPEDARALWAAAFEAGLPSADRRRAAWERARLERDAGAYATAMHVLLPFSEDDARVQLELSHLCEALQLLPRALFHAERARTLAPWSADVQRRVQMLRARGVR